MSTPAYKEDFITDTESGSSEEASGSEEDVASWISWFCSLKGNEFFCEVEEDFIQDDFNLSGLSSQVHFLAWGGYLLYSNWQKHPHQGVGACSRGSACLQVPYYDYALDLILDADSPNNEVLSEEQHEVVETAAEMLYGLIHVRYILTSRGMVAMHEKFKKAEFGTCPRVLCAGQPCLPVGTVDIPRQSTVKVPHLFVSPNSTVASALLGCQCFGSRTWVLLPGVLPAVRGLLLPAQQIPRQHRWSVLRHHLSAHAADDVPTVAAHGPRRAICAASVWLQAASFSAGEAPAFEWSRG